jgi:hypothetical protein
MDERLRFVARLLEGEKMAPLCAEFGISRKTGYKIFDRYKDCGVQAFSDRSHRAHRQANRLPAPIEATIVRLKREYPGWGAPKIREKLRQQFTGPHLPAISTVHAVPGSLPPREASTAAAGTRHRYGALAAHRSQWALVCRLQGRVHAGESAVLLPADDHRFREPVSPDVRSAVDDAREIRLHRV